MSGRKAASAELALAKRLQNARKAAGLTQEQLCQKAGLALSTLTKIERGAIKAPSIFTIQNIAAAVNVSLDELMGISAPKAAKLKSRSGVSFVYFDVNGCLIHFFQKAFTKIAEDYDVLPEKVETVYWHYNDDVCSGKLTLDEFNTKLAERLGVKSIDWARYYLDVVEKISETHELAAWVARNYQIGLLTNIMPGVLDVLRHRRQVPDLDYNVVIDSSEVGVVKPNPKIYQIATERAGVDPSEILFVDDSRVNLTAAERLGWQVMWFNYSDAKGSVKRVREALKPA